MNDEPFDFSLLEGRGILPKTFDAGEKVFLQHDNADCMYVVRSGRVDIVTFGTVLDNVGPNGVFGEMALIDGSPRSAAAIAHEPTEVFPVDQGTFLFLTRQNPEFALRIMRLMANRLRAMNANL